MTAAEELNSDFNNQVNPEPWNEKFVNSNKEMLRNGSQNCKEHKKRNAPWSLELGEIIIAVFHENSYSYNGIEEWVGIQDKSGKG